MYYFFFKKDISKISSLNNLIMVEDLAEHAEYLTDNFYQKALRFLERDKVPDKKTDDYFQDIKMVGHV
jgi:hypothetical protein